MFKEVDDIHKLSAHDELESHDLSQGSVCHQELIQLHGEPEGVVGVGPDAGSPLVDPIGKVVECFSWISFRWGSHECSEVCIRLNLCPSHGTPHVELQSKPATGSSSFHKIRPIASQQLVWVVPAANTTFVPPCCIQGSNCCCIVFRSSRNS